jgi:LysM repeat protein
VAYKITIQDMEIWNNISRESKLQIGQRLFIPGENTEGYATPTPVGMILASTPNADGVIMHSVQSYQTLYTISQAYGTGIDRILALNGIQEDWPLQIGQNLLIHPGNVTPTPDPAPADPDRKTDPRQRWEILPHRQQRRDPVLDRGPIRSQYVRSDELERAERGLDRSCCRTRSWSCR